MRKAQENKSPPWLRGFFGVQGKVKTTNDSKMELSEPEKYFLAWASFVLLLFNTIFNVFIYFFPRDQCLKQCCCCLEYKCVIIKKTEDKETDEQEQQDN